MTAFAVGLLRDVALGPDITAYLEGIDETLRPFGGRFLIHGGRRVPLEGRLDGDLVVIAFPGLAEAEAWYASPGYQRLLPLRTRNADSVVFLIEGAPSDHRATDVLQVEAG